MESGDGEARQGPAPAPLGLLSGERVQARSWKQEPGPCGEKRRWLLGALEGKAGGRGLGFLQPPT